MSKEAMKLTLARLQARTDTADLDAIAALKKALAEQPAQQEPVGYVCFEGDEVIWTDEPPESGTQLYTSQQPAQRTWVGLTEQDLDYLCNLAYTGDEEFALAVQAKLMEKNA